MDETKHFYSLDLFRGFCGYGVAFCHLQAFIYKNLHMEYLVALPSCEKPFNFFPNKNTHSPYKIYTAPYGN